MIFRSQMAQLLPEPGSLLDDPLGWAADVGRRVQQSTADRKNLGGCLRCPEDAQAVNNGLSTRMARRSRCNGTPIPVNPCARPEVTVAASPDKRPGPISHAASFSDFRGDISDDEVLPMR
ncbi:hypothetical protein [Phyllobacterium bourgognense]|uniref:Uncharacterized protein n=1 Tax=Phyllobacterium bourgognense TaxID=314236 RepID=A0A368YBE7_9HYPH|nr:hypothetical protein [Phyllobacterium bourgognense]RCW77580.1 hypothetical protein C7476_1445 [Phyllobacterium bourgognense]